MKLFSRKSLVAAVTSAALVSGVLVAPANAETQTPSQADVNATQEATEDDSSNEESNTGEGEDNTGGENVGDGDDTDGETNDDSDDNTPEPEEGSSEGFFGGSSDDDGKVDPGQIRDWVAVFTAIIGALSTVFVFMERNFN
ncbi:hypothetical protein [Corynebacterium halotolerans]|uniref:hypothetical protein n=1 Tax=Corynebacterium halotolerans TaxID=225326 RepID=UPI003CE6B07B